MLRLANRIILTELCNESCPHCFNANCRSDKSMDSEKFIEFMNVNKIYLREYVLKIMGGEPTLYPTIIPFIKEALKYYSIVDLFTNGGKKFYDVIKDPVLLKNHLYDRLRYIINFYTFKEQRFLEYLDYIKVVGLHYVISPYNWEENLKKLENVYNILPANQLSLTVSPDTTVNIFDEKIREEYRKIFTECLITISNFCYYRNIFFSYDHNFPLCFFTQEMRDLINQRSYINVQALVGEISGCCCERQIGLIDTNFDLYFCNQNNIKIGSILNEDGKPKNMVEIYDMIKHMPSEKMKQLCQLNPSCSTCPCLSSCKGGCFLNPLREVNK